MSTKTLHVYQHDGGWAVKKEGRRAEIFGTKAKAVLVAIRHAKNTSAAQIAVYGKDGRITDHRTYGMPRIQELPQKKSALGAMKIARAVGKVVLDRLRSDPYPRACEVETFS